jgi:hypothetical protein
MATGALSPGTESVPWNTQAVNRNCYLGGPISTFQVSFFFEGKGGGEVVVKYGGFSYPRLDGRQLLAN